MIYQKIFVNGTSCSHWVLKLFRRNNTLIGMIEANVNVTP